MVEAAKILYKDYLKAKQDLSNEDDNQKGDKLEMKNNNKNRIKKCC